MHETILSLASDFASDLEALHGYNKPADEYFDPLIEVLGEAPTKQTLLDTLRSGVPSLTAELSSWLELELEETVVQNMLYRAIINIYGQQVNEP